MSVQRDPVKPGQDSVWDYPRPAVAQACTRRVQIIHKGHVLADTKAAVRTLETSHPPSYYIPRDDIAMHLLRPGTSSSFCEWKGSASYFDAVIGGDVFANVGWSYPKPTSSFMILKDHIAFYATPFDQCLVDGEKVQPQQGGFYGGWITSDLAGPFKGIPGSRFW